MQQKSFYRGHPGGQEGCEKDELHHLSPVQWLCSVGEKVEKSESFYILSENANQCN